MRNYLVPVWDRFEVLHALLMCAWPWY